MEDSSQQASALQEHNDWRNSLFDTLKLLWKNYLDTPPEDVDAKEHWIHLFLFYYQCFDDDNSIFKSDDYRKFFNSIPEEVCSFLLQHVYTVICQTGSSILDCNNETSSLLVNKTDDNPRKCLDDESPALYSASNTNEGLRESHNFSQLILKTPADCSKVIALRNYLTDKLGHHILAFLLKVDIKLIASQKGLCNLCINLFPHCVWKPETNAPLLPPKKVLEFVGHFHIYEFNKLCKVISNLKQSKRNIKPTNNSPCTSLISFAANNINSMLFLEDSLNKFKAERKTSDEIAYMLVRLLVKCATNECESPLSEESMSIVLLNFALSKMPVKTNYDNNYSSFYSNATIIKCALLQLIELCLNNIFADETNIRVVDFRLVLTTLSESYPSKEIYNSEHTQDSLLTLGLSFIIFAIIHNLIVIESRRLRQQHQQQTYVKNMDLFIRFNGLNSNDLMHIAEICGTQLRNRIKLSNEEEGTKAIYNTIINVMAKIIENLQKIENLTSNSMESNCNGVTQIQRPRRRRFFNLQQVHCNVKQLQPSLQRASTTHCFFQGLMLELQTILPRELQEHNLRYWLRVGLCCCQYTLLRVGEFLSWILHQTPIYQKYTYKFLHRKILNAIFVRPLNELQQPLQSKRRSNFISTVKISAVNCNLCDEKFHSMEYHMGLLEQYRKLYYKMKEIIENTEISAVDSTQYASFILFLKHLKDIAPLLPNDIAVGILAEIVLPIFRQYKSNLMELLQHAQSMLDSSFLGFWQIPQTNQASQQSTTFTQESLNYLKATLYQRMLSECLIIFVTYLNDIRLIKAFYNEENIQHLEDLITEPELVCGICELIKIGVENVTFLGDDAREQANLSKRLITLLLKSSKRAEKQFNVVLRRLSKFVKPLIIKSENSEQLYIQTFWLDEKNCRNDNSTHKKKNVEWVAYKHLTPQNVLKNSAVLWSLNNDLLRSSNQFNAEFSKNYLMVSGENMNLSEEEHSNTDDSSLIDILKLNYNVLSAFLLIGQKKNYPSTTTPNLDEMSAQCDTIDEKTLFKNLTSISSFDYLDQSSEHNVDVCFSNSLNILEDRIYLPPPIITSTSCVSFDSIATDHADNFCEGNKSQHLPYYRNGEEINSNVLSQFLDPTAESIVIFDIRKSINTYRTPYVEFNSLNTIENEINTTKLPYNKLRTKISGSASLSTSDHSQQKSNTHEPGVITTSTTAAAIASVQNNESVVGKLFRMFGSFLGLGSLHLLANLKAQQKKEQKQQQDLLDEVDEDLRGFFQPQGVYKKFLLKIFEATMAICIKGYQNENAEKMQQYLNKLKSIILSNSFTYWQQYSEESAHENPILQALQVLLQIAELSNVTNETLGNGSAGADTIVTAVNNSSNGISNKNEIISPTKSSNFESSSNNHRRMTAGNFLIATPPTTRRCESSSDCVTDSAERQGNAPSHISTESDVDLSENDRDPTELSRADEGYEADGEVPEISDSEQTATETGIQHMWNQLQPTSRFRTYVIHKGLCRLIVSIMIELTQKCTVKPVGWSDSLTQLGKRLFVIRDFLGGSQFMLQSFKPLLESNDTRLIELQKSILELITEVNTPETLYTLFNILTVKTAPVDLILRHMHYICTKTLRKAQPFVELEFPITIDGNCISTADPLITERIDRVRNYHLHSQSLTPFTRAPCIIPVVHSRVWNNDGLTLTLWFQAKMTLSHKGSSHTSQTIDEDIRSSLTDDGSKTHIASIGTSHIMICVYLSNNFSLSFELIKPNGVIQQRPLTMQPDDAHNANSTLCDINKQESTPRNSHPDPVNNVSLVLDSSSTLTVASTKHPEYGTTPSTFRKALKQTKQVLLNSFSNIIHGPHDSGGSIFSNESCFDSSATASLKNCRLQLNKWTHLAMAIDIQQDNLDLFIYIDGMEYHKISIPCRNVRNLTRSHSFQMIALGDSYAMGRSANNSSNYNESQSSFDCNPLQMSFSNLMLFNRRIGSIECLRNLTAMGPDFVDLTSCQIVDRRPNFGYLNLTKISEPSFGNFVDCMRTLKEMRVLMYTAQQTDIVTGYDTIPSSFGENVVNVRPFGLILYGELVQNHLQSLQTAVLLCGGLSTLLYLFARVVEASNSAVTQSFALDILLSAALSDTNLYTEFLRNDYTSLIGYVIKTDRCTKDVHILRSIVNNACSQPLIQRKSGDALYVNENTTTVLVYPRLLISILHRYSDWHRSGTKHSDVLDMLFQSILALTREKHPQRNFNMEQLREACLFQALLNLCKVYFIESPNPIFISKYAAQLYVEIIAVFSATLNELSLIDEIMKLLLLLHRPSECYITHDRSNFYFLLSCNPPPAKEKTLAAAVNLNRVAAPFRRNTTRERPGVAIPVSNVQTNPNNLNVEGTDMKRAARLNNLKRIHDRNLSLYKRSVRDLEENLESVANCSKLNKNALKLIDPGQASQWPTLIKRNVKCQFKSIQRQANNKFFSRRLYVTRTIPFKHKCKRSRVVTSFKEFSSEDGSRNLNRNSGLPCGESINGDKRTLTHNINEYMHKMPPSLHRRPKSLLKTDFYLSQGLMTLQEGLYEFLKNFLCLLPDNKIDEVFKHFIKVEILIVLSNHSSCAVRTAILKLLAALWQRLPSSELLALNKSLYPQHLANQLSVHPTDVKMFEACFEWIYDVYGDIDIILNCPDMELRLKQRFGVNALFAITTKLTINQAIYVEKAFRILRKVYECDPEEQHYLIENGLLQCCVKTLHYLYSKSNILLLNKNTENAIVDLIITVGKNALKSVGHMNIVWDILNMLAFYQRDKPDNVMAAFREVQSQVQLNWINMFFGERSSTSFFKVIPLGSSPSSPTLSETKTRLDLLIDRSCQFFTVDDTNHTPAEHEIELFEFLVSYCIATNQRCNNFIAWGLQPNRPIAFRAYIIDSLWAICQGDVQSCLTFDGKMIKYLLRLSLEEDLKEPLENLERLYRHLGIDENDWVWNLETELDRLKKNCSTMSAKQKSLLEKTVYKFEPLALGCIESSMVTTRRVAELQNAERKLLMSHMKDYDETATYTKWLEIIKRMTHEGAPWYCKERYENSWELDDTEGPSRVHTRLRRCHLDIDKRFIMPDFESETTNNETELNLNPSSRKSSTSLRYLSDYIRPLDYLTTSYDQQLNISLNSQILYNFPAKYLPVDGEIDGEIIITDHKLYFLATYRCKYFYVTCDISNISEIWIKRYQHQEKAFEIFLDTNRTLFFSLQNHEDCKIMRDIFCDKISQPDQTKVSLITQQWREGNLTNWEYLMTLNQIAGRTYNDLMQYPVFPWILSNYNSEVLDLHNPENFRKLEKPIAVQHKENEKHYINNYTYINNTMTNMGSLVLKPYHYSSHYSNSGTVLHFLVRVPPFTSYFLRYQDNNFDLPDRTFHALNTTWNLASRDSPTDVKELIPEFFCLPEMFENFERFNFGCRQNGERVDNVLLPQWCYRDSRLFVLIHRQALECEVVRRGLHQWIDLIFGFKQTGQNAIEAINVFHPATYSAFMDSEILDPIERRAVETMVKTYGQMPRQLFKTAHPASKYLNNCLSTKAILESVNGLRWGMYLGSPQLGPPMRVNTHKLPGAEYLVCFSNTNVIYGLPAKSCVMQGIEMDTYNVVSWGHNDRIVRIQSLNKPQAKLKNLVCNGAFDEITVCGTDPNSNQLWFGHRSGRITVYKCLGTESSQRAAKGRQNYVLGLRLSYNSAFRKVTSSSEAQVINSGLTDMTSGSNITSPSSSATSLTAGGHTSSDHSLQRDICDSSDLYWIGPTVLIRHTDEITSICLSTEFKIAVSAGRDGLAVIWDLNDWSYVRTIQRPSEIHHSPVTLIAISPTLGDIVTVHTIPQTDYQTPSDSNSNMGIENSTGAQKNPKSPSVHEPSADECFEVTEESLDDFVNVSINPNGKSMLRLHTVNARYVHHILQEEQITAICYSYIKEGVGVNVIATAIESGVVRFWSSWNLSLVSEIITGTLNIKSITYSTHQHLVLLTKEAHIQVWGAEGLNGSAPKFPQISYK